MNNLLIISAIVIVLCVMFNKISSKIGIPMLLFFILLGMVFGTDGIFKIDFGNYNLANDICSTALIFIMFYGGFGTKWSAAKPIAVKAVLLSSLGVIITAFIVAILCHTILGIGLIESLLIGSVISSTDAASVFSILRSRKLGLKFNTASLLEVESGSNDPFLYMLTAIFIAIISGGISKEAIITMVILQILLGILFGVLIAFLTKYILEKVNLDTEGFDTIFVVAMAIISYAIPSVLGGNGYLSVYITGIILGNVHIQNKKSLVNFFDGMTGLMQVLIFFLLGLLSYPSKLIENFSVAIAICLFLTLIARPISVALVLTPFKCSLKQQLLIAFAGLRGAASIVFAIMVYISPANTSNDIFSIVLCIVLISILIQGTFLPFISKKLDMIDENADVLKTFSDYSDEVEVNFIQLKISKEHLWIGKTLREITIPPNTLIALLIRNNEKIVPNGDTIINEGDTLVLAGRDLSDDYGITLNEVVINKKSKWVNSELKDVNLENGLIIMIKREDNILIPNGQTKIKENDILVLNYMK